MTDTDLITAGDTIPNTSSDTGRSSGTAAADSGEKALATMVLPKLRALASEVGVKGTSGMRKSDLIAAIRAHQGGQAAQQGGPSKGAQNSVGQAPQPQGPAHALEFGAIGRPSLVRVEVGKRHAFTGSEFGNFLIFLAAEPSYNFGSVRVRAPP